MAIFNSYVKLPEGKLEQIPSRMDAAQGLQRANIRSICPGALSWGVALQLWLRSILTRMEGSWNLANLEDFNPDLPTHSRTQEMAG